MGVGVADDTVCFSERAAVNPVAELCQHAAILPLFPILYHGVINRDEKVDDHCFLSEPPSKQGQNQLRCKSHKNGIVLLQGHCTEFAIDMKQPARIALFRTAEDIDARSGFPQLCDFLGVSQVIQIFGGDEKHVFSSIEMHA